jgi:PAS domain S-box-containing protein
VSVDSLHLQVASAVQKLATLQRRVGHAASSSTPKLFQDILHELDDALEELMVTQQHLSEQHEQLAVARRQVEIEREKYWQFFDGAPDAYVVTTPDSRIVEANRAASELLNISQRFLVGKNLSLFVCNDRTRLLERAQQLAQSRTSAELTFSMRPRERAPFSVSARVVAAGEPMDASLRWLLRRADHASSHQSFDVTGEPRGRSPRINGDYGKT